MQKIKANELRPGDKFKLTRVDPVRNVKAVRSSGGTIYVDIGLTSVRDLYVLDSQTEVWLYKRAEKCSERFL
jgi:hypothetical protein